VYFRKLDDFRGKFKFRVRGLISAAKQQLSRLGWNSAGRGKL